MPRASLELKIGPHVIDGGLVLAPMAGVTDPAFRRICRRLGAGLAVGEMASSRAHLALTSMTQRRLACDADDPLPVVQLLGADPREMAAAAQTAAEMGARIIDINFGCPARVVCGKACGSALMREPALAQEIMRAVVEVMAPEGIPVTVKMRTGWDEKTKNALCLAKMAQDAGVSAVTVHGRTRAQRFSGAVNRRDIAQVVQGIDIPVVANGDIRSPELAGIMLDETGAAGLMIGRAARGNPWIFSRTRAVLEGRPDPGAPDLAERRRVVLEHLAEHLSYWTLQGTDEKHALRSFRMHLSAYLAPLAGASPALRELGAKLLRIDAAAEVEENLETFFCLSGKQN